MLKKTVLSFVLLSFIASNYLAADDSLEDDLGGFETEGVVSDESGSDLEGFGEEEEGDLSGFGDDSLEVTTKISEEVKEESMFSLTGNVAFKTAYGYRSHSVDAQKGSSPVDYSGFNQAQSAIALQLDTKLSDNWKVRISGDAFYDAVYNLHPSNNYNQDTLDTYKTQLRFNDTYIQGRLSSDIDLKVGRQIVVWGKSDSIRITDVINPLDNRLPGLTDIEDLRLSTTMAKLDYYLGSWNLSAMLIGENRIMLEAAPRSEFFPVDSVFPLGAPEPFIELDSPDNSWDNIQYAVAVNGVFSGWDLSFYGADVLDQKWHLENAGTPDVARKVSKVKMLGSAINIALGAWLLKSEVAFLDGVRYNSTLDDKQRLDALIGFDYMGFKDTVLSLEVANRHIFDYETQMNDDIAMPDYVDRNELQTALRATRSFSNDSINVSALVSMFGASWEYGGFARVWMEYDVVDAVTANIGVVDYISGDKPFIDAISNNDKVFADITYSF